MSNPTSFEVSNPLPSRLNLNPSNVGVVSQLQNSLQSEPHFDGVKIEDMRGNPLYDRLSKIDKIGLAQNELAKRAEVVSKSKYVRQLNRQMSKQKIPN